jgi:signal transduction histidine kinase
MNATQDAPNTILRGRWLLAARASWLAVAAFILGLVTGGFAVGLDQPELIHPKSAQAALAQAGVPGQVTVVVGLMIPMAACAATGLLIFWRRSDDWAAMLFALTLVTGAGISIRAASALERAEPALWFPARFVWTLATFLSLIVLFVFPDGRLVPRWTRLLVAAAVPAVVLMGDLPRIFVELPDVPPGMSKARLGLAVLVWSLFWGAGIYAQVYRYRHVSGPVQQQQIKWVALAFGLICSVLALGFVVPSLFVDTANAWFAWALLGTVPLFLLFPASIAVAILRHHLYDIDRLISRTVVYGLLTVGGVGVYVGVVKGAEWLLRERVGLGASLAATALIAVGFAPARDRLQRLVDWRLYGERHDPVRAVARLGERLRGTPGGSASGDGLAEVLHGVCETLRLPFASLRAGQVEIARVGRPGGPSESVALDYGGQRVGELVVGARSGEDSLGVADRRVLGLLAAPVAVALHAVLLSQELQRSRERLVAAREEERRRLRRDLHDGLGPILTAVTLKADAARSALAVEPNRTEALLVGLRGDAKQAIGDLRRVVYDLRPAALDELGLLGALRQQVDRFDRDGVPATLQAPAVLPVLPAAVEVAALRIIAEALTNIARHANAHQTTITLAVNDDLCIEVCDDGTASTGAGQGWRPGVGLGSMAERAAEVGGTLQAGPTPTGGRVQARLPLELG